MEKQVRATYDNALNLLARFGATLDNVVERGSTSSTSTPHSPPRAR